MKPSGNRGERILCKQVGKGGGQKRCVIKDYERVKGKVDIAVVRRFGGKTEAAGSDERQPR